MATTLSDVISSLSSLPPFPKITTKLLSMLNDDTASVEDLSSLLSTEPALVMKVIHVANSPFYMISQPIEDVSEAIFVLGINTIKDLTTALSLQAGFNQLVLPNNRFKMELFWKHSYATATAGSYLMKNHGNDSSHLYIVGLIHDIGKIIQAYHWPEAWKCTIEYMNKNQSAYEEVEQMWFGWSHADITMALCNNWEFPEDMLNTLRDWVEEFPHPRAKRTSDLFIANEIANLAGYSFPPESPKERSPEVAEEYANIIEELPHDVEHQLAALYL